MPKVDAPYIIGVIREKEKGFLQVDEYTRIIGAPTAQEAVHALADTPYGIHLEQASTPFEALEAHLYEELTWLQEVVNDDRVLMFMTARHDGLRIASAFIHYMAGKPKSGEGRSLSSLPVNALTSVIWEDTGYDELPGSWREFTREEKVRTGQEGWSKKDLLLRVKDKTLAVMRELAFTPLMKEIQELMHQRIALDASVRTLPSDVSPQSHETPLWVSEESLEAVEQGLDATRYEFAFDSRLMDLIRTQRATPTGYDPIIAYWMAKEIEVRTLRLLLSAKLGGLPQETLRTLIRPRYLAL
ncbi:MAG: V-type ATPase subunit [Candidatus Andersenbacteria bacterium]